VGRIQLPKKRDKAPSQLEKLRHEAARAEQELARIKAETADLRDGKYLGVAPITFRLEKLKK
jgi:hypothetical protein